MNVPPPDDIAWEYRTGLANAARWDGRLPPDVPIIEDDEDEGEGDETED